MLKEWPVQCGIWLGYLPDAEVKYTSRRYLDKIKPYQEVIRVKSTIKAIVSACE